MQEWLNWQHWKCCVLEKAPWVRIPPFPFKARRKVKKCKQRIILRHSFTSFLPLYQVRSPHNVCAVNSARLGTEQRQRRQRVLRVRPDLANLQKRRFSNRSPLFVVSSAEVLWPKPARKLRASRENALADTRASALVPRHETFIRISK